MTITENRPEVPEAAEAEAPARRPVAGADRAWPGGS